MKKNGFTLIETLVAIAILMLAISGPLYAAHQALVSAEGSGDRLTAQYLAQEGIEYVRMLRDNAFLANVSAADPNGAAWDTFLNGSSMGNSISFCRAAQVSANPAQCTLDPFNSSQPFSLCTSGGSCPALYLSNGVYSLTQTGTLTPFVRTFYFYDVSATEESVDVQVDWQSHGVSHTIKFDDTLTSWQ